MKVLKTLDSREAPAALEELDMVLYKSKISCRVKEYAGTPLVVQTNGGAKKGVATGGFVVFLPLG